ncbi:MAG: M64 family metallo-endopeptidase, partial [Oscillospiraceae bacterium]|nr:M64 family metallo-endopeptidase [Oscillospiraceae bacterium]
MMRRRKKQLFIGFLAVIMTFTLMSGMAFASSEVRAVEETPTSCCYDCLQEGCTIDEIREIVEAGGQIYQNFRVHSYTGGTTTYRVPVCSIEIEHLMTVYYSNVQPLGADAFTVHRIMYSELSHADSIVIILLGDGFAEGDCTTVLNHAESAMATMLSTHPFGEFSHLFTVYVINVYGYNPNTLYNGRLGTIAAPGGTPHGRPSGTAIGGELTSTGVLPGVNGPIRVAAREVVGGLAYEYRIDMIQVISNATDGTGFAWNVSYQPTNPTVAVTSIRTADNPPGGDCPWFGAGTFWHGIFVHEFGHSFGNLRDEHDQGYPNNLPGRGEASANSTRVPDTNIKWQHWAGYRNVLETPIRFRDGWVAPTAGLNNPWQAEYGCIMAASSANRNFCGVCTAELVRRMARISQEPFHGRSPATNRPSANTLTTYPWVDLPPILELPQDTMRILDSAFHGNGSLQAIVIPPSVETIGDFAFIGTENLTTIHNRRVVPQQINNTTFAGVTRTNVTVYIPQGTREAYIAAGWHDFILVETVPGHLYAKFELYTSTPTENNYIRVPVEVGQPLDVTSVEAALEELDKEARFAFWGWFTEEALNASGRRSTASNVAAGLRRPVVGTNGFDVEQVITQEVLDRYAQGGIIHLRSVWSLWGDVNDDGRVDIDDIDSMRRNILGLVPRLPMNRAPGDVYRDGVLDIDDIDTLRRNV